MDITTIEGLGNQKDGYHPLQESLARYSGTQCGYCSPGMVMNMNGLMESKKEKLTLNDVENSFGGNICRCTGYRPILEAFKTMAVGMKTKVCEDGWTDIEDLTEMCHKNIKFRCGSMNNVYDHKLVNDNKQWFRVTKVSEIFEIFCKIKHKPYMLVAGNTANGNYI